MNKPENFPESKQDWKKLFDELNKVWEKSSYTFITVDTQTKLRDLYKDKVQQIEHFAKYAFVIFKSYYTNELISRSWYNGVHINNSSINKVELRSKKDAIALEIRTYCGEGNYRLSTLLIPFDMIYNPREYENRMRKKVSIEMLGYLENNLLTLKQEVEDKETRIHNIKRSLELSKD